MKLKFHPNGAQLPRWPGRFATESYGFVGREFDPKSRANVATVDPAVVDSATAEGRRLVTLCRRDGALLPADEATAAFCGVKFRSIERVDGAWRVVSAPSFSAPKSRKAD